MKRSFGFLGAALVVFLSGPASAQWVHNAEGSAFDAATMHMAFTGVGEYGVAIRCTNVGDLEIVLIAPEEIDDATISDVNSLGPEMLIRVDDLPPMKLDAKIGPKDNSIVMIAAAPMELLSQVKDGKKEMSSAFGLMGDVFHEQKYNLIGSTAAIEALITGCGLPQQG